MNKLENQSVVVYQLLIY